MSAPDGQGMVILRRLDALQRAIEGRSWQDVAWHYDNVRSAVERRLGVRGRPHDEPDPTRRTRADVFREAAEDTDTFRFTIENKNPDRGLTLSAEALDATGDEIKAWVAARLLRHWQTTGIAPKFANIDVKVGLE